MVLDGITCKAYGPIKTVVSQALKGQKNSDGRLFWYDLGVGLPTYDNLTITFIVASENGPALEALVRTQQEDSVFEVALSGGEWLYDYTGDFTIQSYKTIPRPDRDYTEYGYEVTIATAEPIDMLLLAGDRTPCVGAGYITYNGVLIPQPKDYNFEYQTHKYTGLTHGSSFSEELPTIERDRTKFNVKMHSGNMRAMVDAMSTTRGAVFFTTFPAFAFPFGLQRLSAERQYITIRATDSYEFSTGGDDMYSTVVDLYSIDEDYVSFIEAGVDNPIFLDAQWSRVMGTGTAVWSGSSVDTTAATTATTIWVHQDKGAPSSARFELTRDSSLVTESYMTLLFGDFNNQVYIRRVGTGIRLWATMDGGGSYGELIHTIPKGIYTFKARVEVKASSMVVYSDVYDVGSVLVSSVIKTIPFTINSLKEYGMVISERDGTSTWNYTRIEGVGYGE